MKRLGSPTVETEEVDSGTDWYGFGTGRITYTSDEQNTERQNQPGFGLKTANSR